MWVLLSLLKLPCNPTFVDTSRSYVLLTYLSILVCSIGSRAVGTGVASAAMIDRTTFLVEVTFYEVKWYVRSCTLIVCMARAVNSEDIGNLPLQPFMTRAFTLRSHQKQAQSIVMQKYSSAQGPTQIFPPTIVPSRSWMHHLQIAAYGSGGESKYREVIQ